MTHQPWVNVPLRALFLVSTGVLVKRLEGLLKPAQN